MTVYIKSASLNNFLLTDSDIIMPAYDSFGDPGSRRRRSVDAPEGLVPEDAKRMIRYGAAAVGGVILLSAVVSMPYCVDANEQAVVQRTGAYNRTEGPGFNLKFPWPWEGVSTISTEKVRRLELGYRTIGRDKHGKFIYENFPEEVTMMTNDQNIAIVEFSVQYKIRDAFDYKFNVQNTDAVLKDVAQAAMRQIVAGHSIDQVLISDKPDIQDGARFIMQTLINQYGMGISITNVQLGDVRPPEAVQDAFNDVQSAVEDADRLKSEGQTYYNQHVPEARGQAYQLVQRAEAYKLKKVNEATGDASRFEKLYAAFLNNPDITSRQLYVDEMLGILEKVDKIIVDSGIPINLFLDEQNRQAGGDQ